MKKKLLFLIIAVIAVAFCAIACDNDTEKNNDKVSYEITVKSKANWNGAKRLKLFDLTGKQVAAVNIISGKASVDLPDGTYIAEVEDVPDTISYRLPILSANNKKATIEFTNSEKIEGNSNYEILGIVLDAGTPKKDYKLMVCLEPLDGSIGFCLEPINTDENGAAYFSTYSGRYHISVYKPDDLDPSLEDYYNLDEDSRFFICGINEDNTDDNEGK